ncbi:MAG: DUF5662 family protein [Erysipelotrichaceae bacterium]
MNKLVGHFMTITKHKIAVTKLCFRCGLIKQGILHDLSKYSWVEFSAGVKYYQGNRSPIDAQKEAVGYSLGWLHHKGRNKHHWEYWLDNAQNGIKPLEMPVHYVVEMFCDRIAASRIYQKENYNDRSALNYYLNGMNHIVMHEKTKILILDMLQHVSDYGLDSTILYIRNEILKK